MTSVPADTVLVTLPTPWDRVFLGLAIEGELDRQRRNRVPEERLRDWASMADRLRADRLADLAEVPPAVPAVDPSSTDLRGWVSTAQAVDHLRAAGVRGSERYVRRMLEEHRIRGEQVGRKWLVDPASLDSYIAERTAA